MSYIGDQANKILKDVINMNTPAEMKAKEANATPEEKKQIAQIKKNLSRYVKNKDIDGAMKYLDHLKTTLT